MEEYGSAPNVSFRKMAHYKELLLHTLENGFIIRPYHLSHVIQCVLGQLMTSVKVEVGRYDARTPNNQGFGPLQKIMD